MEELKRRSPVSFKPKPVKTENRNNWTVVLEYEAQGDGPHLIDLSHRAKWDVQDSKLAKMKPWGVKIPKKPGQCAFKNGILINRMNRTQASVWHLMGERLKAPEG
ncbi:MAG: sarcosine oxidase subunit gamma SoxG, partial [bacterium]|nr:sarcosine oxidase subunit gamma SoxG [bacterium]